VLGSLWTDRPAEQVRVTLGRHKEKVPCGLDKRKANRRCILSDRQNGQTIPSISMEVAALAKLEF
jgi:hypothetical protein